MKSPHLEDRLLRASGRPTSKIALAGDEGRVGYLERRGTRSGALAARERASERSPLHGSLPNPLGSLSTFARPTSGPPRAVFVTVATRRPPVNSSRCDACFTEAEWRGLRSGALAARERASVTLCMRKFT